MTPSDHRPIFLQNVIRAWATLGGIAYNRGRFDEAAHAYHRAITVQDELAGSGPYLEFQDDDRANTKWILAKVYREMGRYAEAETLLREALSIAERYASREAYLASVRTEAQALVAARHALAEDVEGMVERAGQLWDVIARGAL